MDLENKNFIQKVKNDQEEFILHKSIQFESLGINTISLLI